jgi:hypothetical protein
LHRRRKQIYDERHALVSTSRYIFLYHFSRLSQSYPAQFEDRARLRFLEYNEYGFQLSSILPQSFNQPPDLPWTAIDEVSIVICAYDEESDHSTTERYDKIMESDLLLILNDTESRICKSLSLLNALSAL